MQLDLLNVPTVMVPPSAAEWSRELLQAYLPEVQDHLQPTAERSPWHIVRMLVEALCFVWIVRRIGPSATAPTTEEP